MSLDAHAIAAGWGALIGLVLALTGAGGGILAIPALTLGLGLSLQQAAPAALAAVGIASAVGATLGLRKGIVRYRAAALIGALGIVTAPLGVVLAQRAPHRPLMAMFAVVMAYAAWRLLQSPLAGPRREDLPCRVDTARGRLRWTAPCARALAGTGAVSGLLSGLLGVGGGFVIVPALTRHTDLDIRSIQATSLAVIALVSASGVSAAAWSGSLDIGVTLPFTLGASLAMLAGLRLARRMQPAQLKRAFAWLSLAVAALMLARSTGVM